MSDPKHTATAPARGIARALLAALLLAHGARVAAIGTDLDHPRVERLAFGLAIPYFDPEHERGLGYHGDEHRFMWAALRAARRANYPVLNAIVQDASEHLRTSWHPRHRAPYRTLMLSSDEYRDPPRITPAALFELGATLTDGCPQLRTVLDIHHPGERQSSVRADYFATSPSCAADGALDARGIDRIGVVEFIEGSTAWVEIHFVTAEPADLRFVLRRLRALPALDGFAEHLGLPPPVLGGGGGGAVGVERGARPAGFTDPLVFTFYLGWGDCPSGCIRRRRWTVRVTPEARSGPWQPKNFAVELVEATGAPLPQEWTEGLGAGVDVRRR